MTDQASDPPPTSRPPLYVNPASGLREVPHEELVARFPGFAVEEVDGAELEGRVRAAAATGVPVIGVAGGDGSIRSAGEVLAGTDVALFVVPGGTFNHFAKALRIPDLDAAQRTAAAPVVETADVGDINGRCFLNNTTAGWYPEMVRVRERWEQRVPRSVARVVALARMLPRLRRFRVEADREPLLAWVVWIGNGRIRTDLAELGTRGGLDDGVVDVWVARADGRLPRLRQVARALAGSLEESPLIEHWDARSVQLAFRRPAVDVALDGETFRMATPLAIRVRPAALRVWVPGA